MTVIATACPRNCYSTCSMLVHVEKGRISRIEPNPANKATGEGLCPKGLSYLERIYAPSRILHPLLRKKNGVGFEPISWDDALNLMAEKLLALKKEYGPKSLLYYAGSGTKGLLNAVGMKFWRLFGGCTTTYGDLCWPAGLEATRLTLGEIKHNAPWDLEKARLILLWGKNAAETNAHQMTFIHNAREQGAKLVVIDPRRTETAERAELLIQPRPGTDGALALAIAHLLIRNRQVDESFIEKHLLGYEEFKAQVKGATPEKAEAITDVPVKYIHRTADLLGSITPATLCAGYGMQRYSNSGQTMRALIALMAITGNMGKPGAGWAYADLQSAVFDQVCEPLASYPPEKEDEVVRVSISMARLGRDLMRTKDPQLKAAWIERGNPMSQSPETPKVLEALGTLDFRVVVDQFQTDTAREADLILPAKSLFEQSDIIGAYWHPYIQLKQKIIDPPGEVKPESEIYLLLAERLGFSSDAMADTFPEPTDQGVERFLEKKVASIPGLTMEALRKGPVLPPGYEDVAFADLRFPTPSGKIELYSKEAEERWGVDPLPTFTEPVESIRRKSAHPDRFPLYLLTPNTKNRIHSQFNNLEMIRLFSDKPYVLLNPDDAAERRIAGGDRVRVFNLRGEFRLEARLDYSMKPGCVSVTNGWWFDEGGAVNLSSCGRETDMGHGAAFHDNLVEVVKDAP